MYTPLPSISAHRRYDTRYAFKCCLAFETELMLNSNNEALTR